MAVIIKKKSEQVDVVDAKAEVSVQKLSGKTVVDEKKFEHILEQLVVAKPMANIGFKGGRTFNLGDYNSARVEVSLHYPCELDALDETYEKVRAWVDSKMGEISSSL